MPYCHGCHTRVYNQHDRHTKTSSQHGSHARTSSRHGCYVSLQPSWVLCQIFQLSRTPRQCSWLSGTLRNEAIKVAPRHLRLLSNLEDTPLTSVRAAGITAVMSSLGVSELVPLSTVLPVMAMAILCVWATHCSLAHESTMEPTPAHKSCPEPASDHESVLEPSPVSFLFALMRQRRLFLNFLSAST